MRGGLSRKRLEVARTRDSGKSFATLSRGLPQEHAYDLDPERTRINRECS